MTVYKVDNVYYNDESIEQYLDQNYSFADFLSESIKDESGNVRGLLNTLSRVWNSENQNQVVNYLNALNYLYVGYINNVLSNIPKFTVIEGREKNTTEPPVTAQPEVTTTPVPSPEPPTCPTPIPTAYPVEAHPEELSHE